MLKAQLAFSGALLGVLLASQVAHARITREDVCENAAAPVCTVRETWDVAPTEGAQFRYPTEEWQTAYAQKLQATVDRIAALPGVLKEMKLAGRIYGINPEAILGAIATEETLNYNAADVVEDKLAAVMSRSPIGIYPWTEAQKQACQRPEPFAEYRQYLCLKDELKRYDRTLITRYNLVTIGIAQMNPFRVMAVNHLVHQKSGWPLLSDDVREIFATQLNDRAIVHYVAATLSVEAAIYRGTGHFEITKNVGLQATLYNLGKEFQHASELAQANRAQFWAPRNNFLGWMAAQKLSLWRAALANAK